MERSLIILFFLKFGWVRDGMFSWMDVIIEIYLL